MEEKHIQELTDAAAKGDRAALERLIELNMPDLRAFLRARFDRNWRQRESSSDLVQSVCGDLLEHADRFRHPDQEAFRRWLFVTALRKLRDRNDYHRAARRDVVQEIRPQDSSRQAALLERYSRFVTPSRVASAKEELERVEFALEQLPDDYREVIALSRIAGLSHRTIAEEMGRNEGAIRMLLHRALARLVVEVERLRTDAD